MIRNFAAFIVALCTLFSVQAQTLAEQAANAYNGDDFNQALDLYMKVAQEEGTSSELYYNIGNTYYKLGKNGMAILYYEKALLLNPTNNDARSNLEFVNGKANINLENGSTYWKDSLDKMVCSESSSTWGVIGVVSFFIFLALLVIYIFVDTVILRKIGFFGGAIMLLISILTNISAFYVKGKTDAHNQAIVVIPSATLSTSPRQPKDKSEEAFILNEGSKITIIDSISTSIGGNAEKWYDVKADDTHRAWINSAAIEII